VTSGQLSKADACSRFVQIVGDYTMTDDQSASAFGDLASHTADSDLAAAIQRVSDAFARHDKDVPSTEVQSLCG
jgi:hypothetical protein